jgi:hypothetical protein
MYCSTLMLLWRRSFFPDRCSENKLTKRIGARATGASAANDRVFPNGECRKEKVTFRSAEALEEADGKLYFELMLSCTAASTDGMTRNARTFYVSRAYNPNEVFVYTDCESTRKIHLKILSTNISIIHETHTLLGAVVSSLKFIP